MKTDIRHAVPMAEMRKAYRHVAENLNARDHLGGRILLKVSQINGKVCIGINWFQVWPTAWILQTRYCSFMFVQAKEFLDQLFFNRVFTPWV